jgi:hypothetical protein
MEQEVLEMTRTIGIGAQFGGKYFCHDVRVIRLPRHGASVPVGIGVSCSADRNIKGRIDRNGIWLEKLETKSKLVVVREVKMKRTFRDNQKVDLDLDVGKSWTEVGPVGKDRMIRIRVSGDYKLTTAPLTTGPDGLSGENPDKDLLAHVPFGAVMGAIIPTGGPATNEKPPKPFLVGSSYERPCDRDGVLYLKVNVPPNSKCVGKLQVKVGGTIQP